MRRARPLLIVLLWGVLAAGCSHYRLGTGAEPAFTTLYIAPVANKTLIPQSRMLMTVHIREALERDGRVTLVNDSADADATLEVTLTTIKREVAANREDDTGLARKFTESLTAIYTLRDNRSGRMLVAERPVTVQREVFVDNGLGDVTPFALANDQLQSEYNTIPLMAESLADRLSHAVLDVW